MVKAEGGQFGVKAARVFLAALASAGRGGTIKGRDAQDEPAEQADTTAACFALAEAAAGLFYFFLAASAQGCPVAAWASSPAAQRSASCWKALWISGSS